MLPQINLPFFVPALALVSVCFLPRKWGWFIDALAIPILFPALLVLGDEISYPLYITHFAIVQFVKELFAAGSVASVSVACVSAFAVAWVAFVLFDRPARRLLLSRLLVPTRGMPHDLFCSNGSIILHSKSFSS